LGTSRLFRVDATVLPRYCVLVYELTFLRRYTYINKAPWTTMGGERFLTLRQEG